MPPPPSRILVIRLGALGDLVLCMGAFQAIRAAHPDARIALLTMPAFEGFARQMPWFDEVLTDPRAPRWRLNAWSALRRAVKAFAPTRVYDLQGKSRQSILFALLGGPLGPEWSGAAPLCSHPRLWPPVPGMHYTDFIAAQLHRAGIPALPSPDLSWLDGSLETFALPDRFALFIPGCAPDRLYKRWPAAHYAGLADRLSAQGIASVAIGTKADSAAIDAIVRQSPQVISLCGQTSLGQIAALARRAECVIGNDTGPTHLAAAAGGRTLALLSDKVDPHWSCPQGPHVKWLQAAPLDSLGVDAVVDTLTQEF